jgi:hypothetical protein
MTRARGWLVQPLLPEAIMGREARDRAAGLQGHAVAQLVGFGTAELDEWQH